jgi:hypothetical protein
VRCANGKNAFGKCTQSVRAHLTTHELWPVSYQTRAGRNFIHIFFFFLKTFSLCVGPLINKPLQLSVSSHNSSLIHVPTSLCVTLFLTFHSHRNLGLPAGRFPFTFMFRRFFRILSSLFLSSAQTISKPAVGCEPAFDEASNPILEIFDGLRFERRDRLRTFHARSFPFFLQFSNTIRKCCTLRNTCSQNTFF